MKASEFPKSRIITGKDLARQIVEGNRNGRRYCFILGSGASVESRIPTGFQLEMSWMAYLMGEKRDIYDYNVKSAYGEQAEALLQRHSREDTERLANSLYEDTDETGKRKLTHSFAEILEAWTEARENKSGPWKYNFSEYYFDIYRLRFHDNDEDGYRYLERIMERCSPSIGYHPFSLLLSRSAANNLVITTNFDSLVEDAMALYTNQKPLVVSHESLTGFLDPNLSRPMIAKIHRGLFFDPMNSPDLVLAEEWKHKLDHLLAIYTPIVIGYGGGDKSLMTYLEKSAGLKKLYWCVHGGIDQLPSRILKLAASKKEARLVTIKGFDAFMLELGKAIFGPDTLTPTAAQQLFQKQLDDRMDSYAKRWNELSAEAHVLKEELTDIREAEQREAEQREKEEKLTYWDYYWRGYVAVEKRQYEAGIAAYSKAIESNPEAADAYYNRGSAYCKLGNYDEAIADFNKAIELKPDDAAAYNNRGYTYAKTGNYAQALADIAYALKLAPDNPYFLHSLGFTYMKRNEAGDREKALELFAKAISLDASYIEPYEDRAKLYRELGKPELAEQDEAKAAELKQKKNRRSAN